MELGKPYFSTNSGALFLNDSLELMGRMPDNTVDLVVTSPPYALHFEKEYGNASQKDYIAWFLPFASEIKRVIKKSGSFVLNIGGTWMPGSPTRSLYVYKLLIDLCDEIGFHLAQEFFWYNPAKMPAPAEWVNVRRIRVKDSVEYIFWLVKDPYAKANNRNILSAYSRDMLRLINKGTKSTMRPSGHIITEKFSRDHGGAIPPNLLQAGNNESNSDYIKKTKQANQKVHPARFPFILPDFFIRFLTDRNDLVFDPFAGSNTTGAVAEQLDRRWIASEIIERYAENAKNRFEQQKRIAHGLSEDQANLISTVNSYPTPFPQLTLV